MITLALQSLFLMGLAFTAAVLVHRRPAALQRLLWLSVFAVLAVLPFLVSLPKPVSVSAPAMIAPIVVDVTAAAESPRDWMFSLWAAGCLLLLLRIALGLAAIAWRTAQAETSPFRIPGARVLLSRHIDAPFTWGIFRHTVLLPSEAANWSEDRLRSTLVHESVHVNRFDALFRLGSQMLCALYWPNLLVWLAAGKLHAAMEQSCDDAVLESGIGAREYAGHLLDVSRAASLGDVAAGTVAMAGAAQLEARLRSILDGSRRRAPLSRAATAAAALAALAVLAPVGVTRLTAQNSGMAMVSGTVSDASGGRVPKALVTLAETKTGKMEAVYSAEDGSYLFKTVPAGEYTLQVRKSGFALYVDGQPLRLKGGDAATFDIVLRIGQISEMMEIVGTRVTPAPPAQNTGAPQRIRVGGNVQAAKVRKMVRPAYPDTAKARGVEGPVLLRAVITREGDIASLDLLNSTADAELAAAAIEAVKQWKYETTLLNGNPVEVITQITINYTLSK